MFVLELSNSIFSRAFARPCKKGKIMQTKKLLLITSFLFFLTSCGSNEGNSGIVQNTSILTPTSGTLQTQILAYVNQARSQSRNCGSEGNFDPTTSVSWNSKLEVAAQRHSDDMQVHMTSSSISHTGTDGSSTGDRVSDAGYSWSHVGENIYYGEGSLNSAHQAVTAWMNSDGHCANIMSKNFTEIGAAQNGEYWTLVFANQ